MLEQVSAPLRLSTVLDTAQRSYGSGLGSEHKDGYQRHQSEDSDHVRYPSERSWAQRGSRMARGWELSVRLVTNATNQRTAITSVVGRVGLGNSNALTLLADG